MTFPIEIFPTPIYEFITKSNKTLNHPLEFMGAGILYTASVLIGNQVSLNVKNTWKEKANLFMALVGDPGNNKSPALKLCLEPLYRIQKTFNEEFKSKLNSLESLDPETDNKESAPVLKQLLISDVTQEAVGIVLENNKNGVGLIMDELTGWIRNFSRYSKGQSSQEQFWLSMYSRIPIIVNRVSRSPLDIENPYVSIIGGIPFVRLPELFSDQKDATGFSDRILFFVSNDFKKFFWTEEEISESVMNNYINVMLSISDYLRQKESSLELYYSKPALAKFIEWYNFNANEFNSIENHSSLKGVIAKNEMSFLRLSIILHVLDCVVTGSIQSEVKEKTIISTIQLIKYFQFQMQFVYDYYLKLKPNSMTIERVILLKSLPEHFTRSNFDSIALAMGIKEKTAEKHIEYFISEKLVERYSHGNYRKVNVNI